MFLCLSGGDKPPAFPAYASFFIFPFISFSFDFLYFFISFRRPQMGGVPLPFAAKEFGGGQKSEAWRGLEISWPRRPEAVLSAFAIRSYSAGPVLIPPSGMTSSSNPSTADFGVGIDRRHGLRWAHRAQIALLALQIAEAKQPGRLLL
ncbi:hypothetical protein LF599_07435 [Pseudodesulfovibrio thermohalotolerans]|uniref:hypothetical protein n=1 Tax=Pseudodesulfovibrio thermohalotolerans TaxID=2880651 RepID=UPI002442091C|nr:hypothetical protein [Pseudodesulfovibrio thermohalotolerans]WFS63987.1 hypothetical protein LF599_07435 [Pseudodesulfovibrio thermohalotolerans]